VTEWEVVHGPKKTTVIFGSEIPHDELINVVYLFCSDLLLFSRKFAKIVQDADHYKNGGHKCRKYEHKNFARENCKSKVAFLQFVYLCAKYWQIIYAETQDWWWKTTKKAKLIVLKILNPFSAVLIRTPGSWWCQWIYFTSFWPWNNSGNQQRYSLLSMSLKAVKHRAVHKPCFPNKALHSNIPGSGRQP